MKKKLLDLIFIAAAALSLQACRGSYDLGPRPAFSNQTMIVTPSPSRTWVPGRYVYKNNRSAWSQGDYEIPTRGRFQAVDGPGNRTPKGNRYQLGGKRNSAGGIRIR